MQWQDNFGDGCPNYCQHRPAQCSVLNRNCLDEVYLGICSEDSLPVREGFGSNPDCRGRLWSAVPTAPLWFARKGVPGSQSGVTAAALHIAVACAEMASLFQRRPGLIRVFMVRG